MSEVSRAGCRDSLRIMSGQQGFTLQPTKLGYGTSTRRRKPIPEYGKPRGPLPMLLKHQVPDGQTVAASFYSKRFKSRRRTLILLIQITFCGIRALAVPFLLPEH
ncbi:hypothetical protein MAR_031006, partial [Mya arenaria]